MGKLKSAFTHAAQNPKRYVFDLEREAAEFYRQFPAHKDKVYFADVRAQSFHGMDEASLTRAVEKLSGDDTFEYFLDDFRKEGGSCVQYIDTQDCVCVFMDFKVYKGMHSPFESRHADIDHAFAFDHETGHAIGRSGMDMRSQSRCECVADAYAAIRHIQRFGRNPALLKNVSRWRAVDMVFSWGDFGAHFTSPVIEKIVSDSARIDFSKLTPQETADRAYAYASKYALTRGDLRKVESSFDGFSMRGLSNITRGNFKAVEKLGAYVQKIKHPLSRKWGQFVLEALLDNRVIWSGKPLQIPRQRFKELRQMVKMATKSRTL